MIDSRSLPAVPVLKAQAKRLRASMAKDGDFISQSEALEYLAHQFGMRDWNTLHARANAQQPNPGALHLGSRISGTYLGHPFTGEVTSITTVSHAKRRIQVHFEQPVDVVASEHFSSFRSRVEVVIDGNLQSAEKTSNGEPHFILTEIL